MILEDMVVVSTKKGQDGMWLLYGPSKFVTIHILAMLVCIHSNRVLSRLDVMCPSLPVSATDIHLW